jgi:hypothetical protein
MVKEDRVDMVEEHQVLQVMVLLLQTLDHQHQGDRVVAVEVEAVKVEMEVLV